MKLRLALCLVLAPAGLVRANPILPVIPANIFNITNYGAVGDGVTTNTTAIQNAITAAHNAGGGTVEIPAATNAWLCGPLTLKSGLNLQIDAGAVLAMLPQAKYPGGSSPTDFITGSSITNFEITGFGVINGQATAAGWWNNVGTSARPYMILLSQCQRVLIQNVTLENPPKMHIAFKSNSGNITIQGLTINTDGTSPNTDGIDLVGTNCLIQNCSISDGDDNVALGTSSSGVPTANVTITNCAFGFGHGVSIGSNTAGGVSNLTVINCTFSGTDYGIRMKSDDSTSGGSGEGGLAQNLFYYNLGMTNIVDGAIVIYSYYSEYGTPTSITPAIAAAQATAATAIPVWRNIVISNLTATVVSGGIAGIIWGRTELPVTNVILSHVNITASKTLDVYNTRGFQFVDSQVNLPAGNRMVTLYNAGITLSNDVPGVPGVTLDGLTSTNSLALDNASASTTATDIFGATPITLNAGALIISNNLAPPAPVIFNFALGTNATKITVTGGLALNSTVKVTDAGGFAPGTYTLFTYSGSLGPVPVLASAPTNFVYAFDTNTAGQVNLVVSNPGPSLAPVSLVFSQTAAGQLQVSWPADHTGWELELQTNALGAGLGTNWILVPGTTSTNGFALSLNPAAGSVFLRLVYP